MYTVHSRPGSGGFVVEAALELTGQRYTVVNVERGKPSPEFLKISPLGQVPVLTLPDGSVLTESAAICLLLAEQHPQAGLAPPAGAPGRAEFLRWMMFMSSWLYPVLLRWFYAQRVTTDPQGIDAVKAAAVREIDRAFMIVEQALEGREWLAAGNFSIADVYLAMLAHWHPVDDRPRAEWVNIVGLCERLKAHPVIAKLNTSHRMW